MKIEQLLIIIFVVIVGCMLPFCLYEFLDWLNKKPRVKIGEKK